jgi:histo-blood group ABO system transferase
MIKKKIGLLVIATNKYISFIDNLISSADKYFFSNDNEEFEIQYHIFTNIVDYEKDSKRDIFIYEIEHKPWPWMTLGRYHIFSMYETHLKKLDYVFYCDADMLFVDHVSKEILSDFTVTIHPGFKGGRGTPETNSRSTAAIGNEDLVYVAGGFNGGSSESFLNMSKKLSTNIDKDFSRGIIAIWHDESHLNRYTIDNKPSLYLSPSYCCPEYHLGSGLFKKEKLVALVKNHEDYRK